MIRLWKTFLAYFRLSKRAVCEMSVGLSEWDDYHDYWDTADKRPHHFGTLKCERCGKDFRI
jgi:hypothetical protein